jgi:hypothetical protein
MVLDCRASRGAVLGEAAAPVMAAAVVRTVAVRRMVMSMGNLLRCSLYCEVVSSGRWLEKKVEFLNFGVK